MAENPKLGPDTKVEAAYKDAFTGTQDLNTAYDQAFNAPTPALPTSEPVTTPELSSEPVNVLNPRNELVSLPKHQIPAALQDGYRLASPEDVKKFEDEQQYGTAGQQVIAGLEGAGRALTFGLSTPIETGLGLTTKEAIKGREEVNPVASTVGEIGGFAAGLLTGGTEAKLLGEGAYGVAKLTAPALIERAGAAAASKLESKLAKDVVRGAVETSLMQGGNEIHKAFTEDPSKVAETAIADIGLSAVLGGVFGGAVGAGLRKLGAKAIPEATPAFMDKADEKLLAEGNLETLYKLDPKVKEPEKIKFLDRFKPSTYTKPVENAAELNDALSRIGVEKAPDGFFNKDPYVRKYINEIIEGPETVMGQQLKRDYEAVHRGATDLVSGTLGGPATKTKAQLGEEIASEFTDVIKAENAITGPAFDQIRSVAKELPLKERIIPLIKQELMELPEFTTSRGTDAGLTLRKIVRDIDRVKSLDGLMDFKANLRGYMSGFKTAPEKRIVAIVADKLKGAEVNSIRDGLRSLVGEDAASQFTKEIEMTRAEYAKRIAPIKKLAEKLGFRSDGGYATINNFVEDLAQRPEAILEKLGRKEDSSFREFLNKEFPSLADKFKQYEKGELYNAVTNHGNKEFSAKTAIEKISKLSPEIQKTMFTAEQLKDLKAANEILKTFPKGYTGVDKIGQTLSLTAGIKREGEHLIASKFIKAVNAYPEIKQANALGNASVKGWNTTSKAIKSILDPDKHQFPKSVVVSLANRSKLEKMVEEYSVDPQKMVALNDNNPSPEYGETFAATSARAVNYLNSIKPKMDKQSPLDPDPVIPKSEQAKYDRQLDIAQNPALVLKHMKEGTLVPQDLVTVQAIYPKYYENISQQLHTFMVDHAEQGKIVPYAQRQTISMFLGQPLDSTMTPMGINSAQVVYQVENAKRDQMAQNVQTPRGRPSSAALAKIPKNYQTKSQASEQKQLKE